MASKIFVLDTDYQQIIQTEIKDEIANSAILRECEESAIIEMMSYLNARFDISNLFPAITKWNSRMLYQPSDYVDYNGTFVRALLPPDANAVDNRNKTPSGDNLSDDGEVGSGFYWTDYTFPNIKDYDADETLTAAMIAAGAYRVSNNIFWKALTTVNDTPAEGANWTEDDPRNAKLVEICCKLALYKAHARISPNQIPDLRVQEHDMAIDWLKAAASGEVSPQLPQVAEEEQNMKTVQYGSETKKGYTF